MKSNNYFYVWDIVGRFCIGLVIYIFLISLILFMWREQFTATGMGHHILTLIFFIASMRIAMIKISMVNKT